MRGGIVAFRVLYHGLVGVHFMMGCYVLASELAFVVLGSCVGVTEGAFIIWKDMTLHYIRYWMGVSKSTKGSPTEHNFQAPNKNGEISGQDASAASCRDPDDRDFGSEQTYYDHHHEPVGSDFLDAECLVDKDRKNNEDAGYWGGESCSDHGESNYAVEDDFESMHGHVISVVGDSSSGNGLQNDCNLDCGDSIVEYSKVGGGVSDSIIGDGDCPHLNVHVDDVDSSFVLEGLESDGHVDDAPILGSLKSDHGNPVFPSDDHGSDHGDSIILQDLESGHADTSIMSGSLKSDHGNPVFPSDDHGSDHGDSIILEKLESGHADVNTTNGSLKSDHGNPVFPSDDHGSDHGDSILLQELESGHGSTNIMSGSLKSDHANPAFTNDSHGLETSDDGCIGHNSGGGDEYASWHVDYPNLGCKNSTSVFKGSLKPMEGLPWSTFPESPFGLQGSFCAEGLQHEARVDVENKKPRAQYSCHYVTQRSPTLPGRLVRIQHPNLTKMISIAFENSQIGDRKKFKFQKAGLDGRI